MVTKTILLSFMMESLLVDPDSVHFGWGGRGEGEGQGPRVRDLLPLKAALCFPQVWSTRGKFLFGSRDHQDPPNEGLGEEMGRLSQTHISRFVDPA